MKRRSELIIFMILSLLLVIEPIVFAKEEVENNIIIKKDDIMKFWQTFDRIYKLIIDETSKVGLGKDYNDSIVIIDKLIENSKDTEISYDNVYYLKDFLKKANKSISQYLPVDVSQIDVASENLPGLFINQIMGLIAPFFTTVGGGISIISVSILIFLAVPSIPLMLVLALTAGIIGLVLGVLIGIPVALIFGLISLFSLSGGGKDNSIKSTAFMANNIEIYKLLEKYPLDRNLLYTDYKRINQDCVTTILEPFINTIGEFIDYIFNMFTETITNGIQSGVLGDTLLIFGAVTIGMPVLLIFGALIIGLIIIAALSSPFFLPIILFVAVGFAIAGIGFALFDASKGPLSVEDNSTYYDIIKRILANIEENPSKHLDSIVKGVLTFSKNIFGVRSYAYFDKLESIILSSNLKTEDGIKEATFKILEFIPQIR
jgi:hypothetical protein